MKKEMKRKNIKEKILLLALICILFSSCGGGGGSGGGSTNLPINPPTSIKPKIEQAPKNISDDKNTNPLLPKVPEERKEESPNNIRENFNELHRKLGEEDFRSVLLGARNKSNEAIPTDNKKVDGSTQKVAILDSNFTKNEEELRKKYPQLEIVKAGGNNSKHGEEVLLTLMENNAKFIPVLAGIGIPGSEADISLPTKELYEKVISKMGNQRLKVINQSFAVIREANSYGAFGGLNDYRAALSTGKIENIENIVEDGEQLVKFYEREVANNSIFVWANGNTIKEGNRIINPENAFLNAGLPKFRSDLEKGWISVVGIQEKNDEGKANIHYKNHLAYPGIAKWWAISADAKTKYSERKNNTIETTTVYGSSYAAPRVSRAAALVAEKFPWMTNDQIRQTLFTTTDKTEISSDIKGEARRRISWGQDPDNKYGWGMLNTERALKGPGSFVNILSQYRHSSKTNNIFKADIPEGMISYFENDIYGDGGLNKLGKGTLHLTGNNAYERGSIVSNGTLEIHKIHSGEVKVEKDGTLVLHSRAIIGYQNDPFIVQIYEDKIKPSNIISKNVENSGTVKFMGTLINSQKFKGAAIIGGDYIAYQDSKTEIDFDSEVAVLGKIQMNGKIEVQSDKYIAETVSKTLMTAKEVTGNIKDISTDGMKKVSAKVAGGDVIVELSRQNPIEYLGEKAQESSKNVAQNVENVFADLDEKVKAGTATQEELLMGATVQSMSTMAFTTATEMMSGEIYASAQALTFSQAQNINRDLSNRLAGLDNLKLSNGETQTWFSAIGSDGKLRRDGYASADTRVAGGQFGLDKKYSNTNLGIALSYSHATADFNRYAGQSKSDMIGISLYGKKELSNNFYAAGRLGISHTSSKVERELVNISGDVVKGKVKHDDIMSSVYLEVGKKFEWLTPFVGYSQDYLRRGSFSESNAAWGIHADSKNYWNSNFLIGLRAEFALNKYKFQTYLTQAINVGKRDLSYEGHFTGNTTKQKYYGVKQAKNTTWVGLGVFREFTPNFGIYGNIDFRFEDGKHIDSVFSTGLQYKF